MSSTISIQPRMKNPVAVIPEATKAIQDLLAAARSGGAPESTMELVHLRASQINGCSFCVEMGTREARRRGESEERLATVAAWREAPYFTDAERAALALAEAMTRMSDRSDPVPDEIFEQAAEHYDERALSAVILMIALTNVFNRVNVTVRQPAGSWR